MLSKQGNSVVTTDNLNLAVALATCGVPHEIKHVIDEATGQRASCLFHLDGRPILNEPGPAGEPALDFFTGTVKKGLEDGTFEKADPCHPVCDAFAGLQIYECIRTFMERAVEFRIMPVVGGEGRCTLIRGHEPACDTLCPVIKTESVALAAALCRMGFPLLRVEGAKPHRQIVLGNYPIQPFFPTGEPPISAASLTASINDGTIAKTQHDHPALYVLMAIHNRAQFLNDIEYGRKSLLLRDARGSAWTKRHVCAVVHGSATGKTIDAARRTIR